MPLQASNLFCVRLEKTFGARVLFPYLCRVLSLFLKEDFFIIFPLKSQKLRFKNPTYCEIHFSNPSNIVYDSSLALVFLIHMDMEVWTRSENAISILPTHTLK